MSSAPAPPADQLVTSSDLVRHFGLWQERAVRAPLYILHRGRPRFVMTSIETMDALCSPHYGADDVSPGAVETRVDSVALLDGLADLILLVGAEGRIVGASRGARAHFGALVASGCAVGGITSPSMRALLAEAIRRVIASGAPDWIELPSAARPGRTLAIGLEAATHGVILFARDATTEEENRTLRAAVHAQEQAMIAAGQMAVATINPRGYLVAPDETLVRLSGLPRDALALVRFVTLAEIGARVALGNAIELALAGETPPPLDASLLVNRADPLAVRIGLAPVRGGGRIDGVVAIIAAHA